MQFETRDPKTGELVRVNADDDKVTLGELLRQERFGAGAADQKDLDAQFARAIATDGTFAVRVTGQKHRLSILIGLPGRPGVHG